jgi:hypothetical protein
VCDGLTRNRAGCCDQKLTAQLAELLTDVDEFLRSPEHFARVWAELVAYCARPGRPDAGGLVDAVSLHAMRLRTLASDCDAATR